MSTARVICIVTLGVLLSAHPTWGQSTERLEALKQEAVAEVERLRTFTQQTVDQIFSFGELGFQEFETSRHVTGILEENGFQVERGVADMPTAWIATWGTGEPVIAFGSDIGRHSQGVAETWRGLP